MATSPLHWTDTIALADPAQRAALVRLGVLTRLLDDSLIVPGTSIRLGLDALIGLVPGLGDVVTTALAGYIVYEARRFGLPRHLVARMIANVVLDFAIGAVPVIGDVGDVLFRANLRNMRLLRRHLERSSRGGVIDGSATRL